MRRVILDTNVILLPFTQGTRLEAELDALLQGAYTVHVPTSVISELKMLTRNQGATGRAAKMALTWAERFIHEPTGLMGDDGILEVGRRIHGVVVTNDRKLQAECVKSGLQVIVARETGKLSFRKAGSG